MNKTKRQQVSKDKLETEVSKGNRYGRMYTGFFEDFIEQERTECIQHFMSTPVREVDAILEIKRRLTTLETLESKFTASITTGKLASKTLTDMEN